VNLAQIRSAVPAIFDSQTKKNKKTTKSDSSTNNRTLLVFGNKPYKNNNAVQAAAHC